MRGMAPEAGGVEGVSPSTIITDANASVHEIELPLVTTKDTEAAASDQFSFTRCFRSSSE